MKLARQAYKGLAYLFVLGVVVQVFLAGAGLFGELNFAEGDDLDLHRDFGFTILQLVPLLMLIAAVIGRMSWTFIGLAVLVAVLVFVQSAWLEADSRWIKAVHPTMAIVLFALGHYLAQSAGRLLRGEATLGARPIA